MFFLNLFGLDGIPAGDLYCFHFTFIIFTA